MRTPVGRRDEPTDRGPPDDEVTAEQPDRDRPIADVGALGDHVPVMLQRLVFDQHVCRLLGLARVVVVVWRDDE